jgi:hypothetical protein
MESNLVYSDVSSVATQSSPSASFGDGDIAATDRWAPKQLGDSPLQTDAERLSHVGLQAASRT